MLKAIGFIAFLMLLLSSFEKDSVYYLVCLLNLKAGKSTNSMVAW